MRQHAGDAVADLAVLQWVVPLLEKPAGHMDEGHGGGGAGLCTTTPRSLLYIPHIIFSKVIN